MHFTFTHPISCLVSRSLGVPVGQCSFSFSTPASCTYIISLSPPRIDPSCEPTVSSPFTPSLSLTFVTCGVRSWFLAEEIGQAYFS
ncbi:hypothetical protein JAAARDRAFT_361357 [Jaapia argillacea MUCL 33604]|uniref:Uncharacterized protein n=1 Tax=Jaapia argillacea MUCL 33604 TaxID=933084 RepID=A0A067Q9Z8_9AGAM|nr:hypothetical protein JAAARDRAFT_361357 [Jaapia argillacea MUCL 33604]